jgi:hypothetical protein
MEDNLTMPAGEPVVFVNRAMGASSGGATAEGLGVMVDEIYDSIDNGQRQSQDTHHEDSHEPSMTRPSNANRGTPSKVGITFPRWVFILLVVLVMILFILVIGFTAVLALAGASNNSYRSTTYDWTRSETDIQDIVAYLNSKTLSGQTLVYPSNEIATTPENLALQWLIEDIGYEYTTKREYGRFSIVQSYALLTLYASTGGSSWSDASGWMDGYSDECSWFGVTSCTRKNMGATIGTINMVTQIELPSNNLHGYLSSDVGLLTHLESFDVGNNSLTGTLPATIGQWSLLLDFDVSLNAGLAGTIPDAIANWTVIDTISVNSTGLAGSIPDHVCDSPTSVFADCNVECSCCTPSCG